MKIHPTAIISKKAKLASDVEVGPYSVIGDNVEIKAGTVIGSHCVVKGLTCLGSKCRIYTGAVIGSQPQDLKYNGEKSSLKVGDNNIIREYCTLNLGTGEGARTVIGDNNLLMAYSHIAHDCIVGNNCVVANAGTLAGHVTIEDGAVVGGLVAIHQFVRVGKFSIVGGCSKVVQDIPPFSTCDGHPARVYGLNLVGLRRHGFKREAIHDLRQVFNKLFNSGLSIKHAITEIKKEVKPGSEAAYLLDFIESSKRGISRSCRMSTVESISRDKKR